MEKLIAIRAYLLRLNVASTFFLLAALVAGLVEFIKGPKDFYGQIHTHYNNYIIFKQSFFHLIKGMDLYILHPTEQWDLYKYSPAFALFMGLFAYLPDVLGLILWDLLNAGVLLYAVHRLPNISQQVKASVLWFGLIEMLTSVQNSQSNALIAGLIILFFVLAEEDKPALAALMLVLSVFIKLFGLVAFALFLLYPKKFAWLKLGLYSVLWTALLALLPGVVNGFDYLWQMYASWGKMLSEDHSVSLGLSVMGWIQTWFYPQINKFYVLIAGTLLFLLPFLRFQEYKNQGFRLAYLCLVMLWIIIFNHKAESPTFVIAMTAAGIWYYALNSADKKFLAVIIFTFIFTSLSPTDIFPRELRQQVVNPYVLKAVGCIAIWALLWWQMITKNYAEKPQGI